MFNLSGEDQCQANNPDDLTLPSIKLPFGKKFVTSLSFSF